jgi:hypothetical protein
MAHPRSFSIAIGTSKLQCTFILCAHKPHSPLQPMGWSCSSDDSEMVALPPFQAVTGLLGRAVRNSVSRSRSRTPPPVEVIEAQAAAHARIREVFGIAQASQWSPPPPLPGTEWWVTPILQATSHLRAVNPTSSRSIHIESTCSGSWCEGWIMKVQTGSFSCVPVSRIPKYE